MKSTILIKSFCCSFWLVSQIALGQILNVEKFRLDKDTSHYWLGNMNLGMSMKNQNVTVNTFNGDLNACYLSAKHAYMSFNRYKLTQINNTDLISEGYLHLRFNFFRKNRLSYEPFTQYQYDLGRGLIDRRLIGFNGRIHFVKKDVWQLNMGTGLMWEHEYWTGNIINYIDMADSLRVKNNFLKLTSHFSYRHKLSNTLTLFASAFYQARPLFLDRPRIITDFILQFRINKLLAFALDYAFAYDNKAIVKGNEILYNLNASLVIKID